MKTHKDNILDYHRVRGRVVERSRLWSRKVSGSEPDSRKICRVLGQLRVRSYIGAKRPPFGVVWELGEGVRAQVSSSSSEQ
ncbi:hypothetical protein AVEN_202513-1, partial [Araneus ventricosus]